MSTSDSKDIGKFCVNAVGIDALNIPKCFWIPGTASIFHGYFGAGGIVGYGQASLVAAPGPFPFTSQMYGVNHVIGSHIVEGVRITNGVDLMTGGTATVATAVWKCLAGLTSINAGKFSLNSAKGNTIVSSGKNTITSAEGTTIAGGIIKLAASTGALTGTAWTLNGAPICAPCPSSDVRLKKDIQPLENALNKVLQLQGVSFKWNEDLWRDKAQENPEGEIGVIAQEVEKIVPEVVREFEIFPKYYEKNEEIANQKMMIKGVKYENLVALLIEGMKEQQKQIDDLKEQIKKLS